MKLMHGDCLSILPTLKPHSVDLIVTDPPYYKVKAESWDNQWESEADFLSWCDQVLAEFQRVLKPSGSLYWFAGPYMAAKIELLINQRFDVLNHLVWVKNSGRHNGTRKESLTRYFPQTERILFAEHQGQGTQVEAEGARRAEHVYQPIVNRLNRARLKAGLSVKECVKICGVSTASHYFTTSQFILPSEANYIKLMDAFGKKSDYTNVKRSHRQLRVQYNKLRKAFRNSRRPFAVTKDVPFTDVWHFDVVQHYPGKHPCEKPRDLLQHIIATSSKPGQVVLDAFMGSGSTGKVCAKEGRNFIGIEKCRDTFLRSQLEINSLLSC